MLTFVNLIFYFDDYLVNLDLSFNLFNQDLYFVITMFDYYSHFSIFIVVC